MNFANRALGFTTQIIIFYNKRDFFKAMILSKKISTCYNSEIFAVSVPHIQQEHWFTKMVAIDLLVSKISQIDLTKDNDTIHQLFSSLNLILGEFFDIRSELTS